MTTTRQARYSEALNTGPSDTRLTPSEVTEYAVRYAERVQRANARVAAKRLAATEAQLRAAVWHNQILQAQIDAYQRRQAEEDRLRDEATDAMIRESEALDFGEALEAGI